MSLHPGIRPGHERRYPGNGDPGSSAADEVPMDRLAKQFFAAIQPAIETPWGVAQNDFVYPDTRGVRPTDFGQRMQYNIALTELAAQDFEVHKLLAEVQHLLKPQSTLREPALEKRVMALMGT
jgi:hypothetical protein